MTITAIEEQKKRKDRVNIFLDGQFAFSLKIDLIWEFHLKIGATLDQNQVKEIQSQDSQATAYDKALNYLSSRPHSVREVRQHLSEKLIYRNPDYAEQTDITRADFVSNQQQTIEIIINKLLDQKLLDDVVFAKWWIENRRTFRPRGKRLLLLELKTRGVSNQDLETALTTPSQEGHFHGEAQAKSEEEMALSLAQTYVRKHPDALLDKNHQMKLVRHLMSKGFDWQTAEVVIKKMQSTSD
jgi:regulatory protein